MAKIRILGSAFHLCFSLFMSSLLLSCSSYDEQAAYNSFTVSSFSYSETKLEPYEWRYIRVDLPPWFSSMSMVLNSDVNLGKETIENLPKSTLPLICFRGGSPPLPDISNTSLKGLASGPFSFISVRGIHDLPSVEQCHLLQKNMNVTLTNEQISSGVWYFGLFNGIGPMRTQSKMITRGPSYSFSANISVEGCPTLTMWGPYCNLTVDPLSYSRSDVYKHPKYVLVADLYNSTVENTISCRNSYEAEFHGDGEPKSQIIECPMGKAGPNCTWKRYMLQAVRKIKPFVSFESYYLPMCEKMSMKSPNFLLEPLLSNFSLGDKLDAAWTYFLLDIPHGAAGGNIHIQLKSDAKMDYEIYARFGGLPSIDTWDYHYANRTSSSSNESMFFKLYDASDKGANFYILYSREGTWNFGVKHQVPTDSSFKHHTTMSISIERCPEQCSSHGTCQSSWDASGLTLYSYCFCDRNHGGFDCSVEIVSPEVHIWQSVALISSNAAAILPAFWALRQKAFAEWVLFTSSGISSGVYHACDVGTWCALSFHVLQFMDFWLSFMAVVSTFVYLASIDEVSKRVIHTCMSIVTALMAATGATRSANIIIVIAIGALALFTGWLIEYSTTNRSNSWSPGLCLNILERWQNIRGWISNFMKTLWKRFRWAFVLMGFVVLCLAAISWKLETSESYWFWHSVWHVTVYTSSFFFLCSKATVTTIGNHGHPGRL